MKICQQCKFENPDSEAVCQKCYASLSGVESSDSSEISGLSLSAWLTVFTDTPQILAMSD